MIIFRRDDVSEQDMIRQLRRENAELRAQVDFWATRYQFLLKLLRQGDEKVSEG